MRSQILEAYLRQHLTKNDGVFSGGIEPSGVDPQAIRIMAEDHLVIAGQNSDHLLFYAQEKFDLIIALDPCVLSHCEKSFAGVKVQELFFDEIEGFGGAERMKKIKELRNQLKSAALNLSREIAS